jgi:hypothetical protein
MKVNHIPLRAMAEVLSGVGDEQIGKGAILTIAVLPLDDAADIDSSVLIVERLAQEAEISGP